MLRFGEHRLDVVNQCLWRGEARVALGPKAFGVLRHLVERAGRLVTKDELLARVWPDTHVGEAVLKTCMLEIRKALGDDSRQPRFVETLHRRGYRFLLSPRDDAAHADAVPAAGLCGRAEPMATLEAALARAAAGTRQMVFVTGDAGIGKTTLVEAFLLRAAVEPDVWIARGQCIEAFGPGEPYRPVLDALAGLSRQLGRERIGELLPALAPTWLVQLPALVDADRRAALQREVHGVAADRMPRELAELVETLTADGPLLVLVLEDLHWSDAATLDLLSTLARRREPARLLVVATYRPIDAAVSAHPLRAVHHELGAHRLAREIPLDFLSEADVAQYLARTVPGAGSPELARVLHTRTDGLPLFLVAVVEELIDDGRVTRAGEGWHLDTPIADVEIGIPESIRRLIERQLDRIDAADRQLLAAASLAGDPFSATIVARALDLEPESVERRCEELAQRSLFLRPAGIEDTPDGTTAARFAFRHALHRRVLQDGVAAARAVRLHRRLGELMEHAWGERASEIAAELASHFEAGHDWTRAVRYRRLAAEHAIARWVYGDALAQLERAEVLLRHISDPATHASEALAVVLARGPALVASRGYAAPEVQHAFARARELCHEFPETPLLFPALWGLAGFYTVAGEIETAGELCAECDAIARRTRNDGLRLEAHHIGWVTSFFIGELARAERHLAAGLPLYDRRKHQHHVLLYGQDACVAGRGYLALVANLRGRPDEGLRSAVSATTLADRLGHPLSRVFARHFQALTHVLRDEVAEALAVAGDALALATEHGFPFWSASATIMRGKALTRTPDADDGVAEMERGIAALRATGARLAIPSYLAILAEAYVERERLTDAERALREASTTADATGQHFWDAEILRLHATITTRRGQPESAERILREALAVARRQGAVGWELRAAVALASALRDRRRTAEAAKLLALVVRRMRGGRTLPAMVAARALLTARSPEVRASRSGRRAVPARSSRG